jgi:uncharacterized protein (DUF169 family)/Pyruvate/2-oxoacid:ferredoxin oxidoreductase delta subunit
VQNQKYADALKKALTLRWSPVAVRLMRPGEEIPAGVVEPATRIRHCQSITAARRGSSMYIPPRRHACPDGAGIMGLTAMSAKLRSGDLYLLFKKLPNIECARKMIATRPEFPAGSYTATLVAPLEKAAFEPDVVIFTLWPEQAMWLCCSSTYGSGERQVFHTSGYNATCADLTVQVMKSQKMNISFGCYGSRAATDIEDFEVYVSIPYGQLPKLIASLEKLAAKSIPEARRRLYMPPVIDSVARPEQETGEQVEVVIDEVRCQGCGLCEAFCPESVIAMAAAGDEQKARVVAGDKCCACYTCVGQCPARAIQLKPARKA